VDSARDVDGAVSVNMRHDPEVAAASMTPVDGTVPVNVRHDPKVAVTVSMTPVDGVVPVSVRHPEVASAVTVSTGMTLEPHHDLPCQCTSELLWRFLHWQPPRQPCP
jgi:hypothetical protein